jgi:hypothetical protein
MAKNATPQTDFDEEVEQPGKPVESLPAVEKDEAGIPYCAKHYCRMRQTSGGKAGSPVSYFKCPVEGCEEKAKRVKSPRSVIPSEPLTCPRCAGLKPVPVMARADKISTAMYTILQCPTCGHKSAPLPRPEFAANHARSRGQVPVEDLGAR